MVQVHRFDDYHRPTKRRDQGPAAPHDDLYDPAFYHWEGADPHEFPAPRIPWFAILAVACFAAAGAMLLLCITVAPIHGDGELWLLGGAVLMACAGGIFMFLQLLYGPEDRS